MTDEKSYPHDGITPEGWDEIGRRLDELNRVVIGPPKDSGSKTVQYIGLDADKELAEDLRVELIKTQHKLIEKYIDRLAESFGHLVEEISQLEETMTAHKSDAPILEYERSPFSDNNEWESMIGKLYAISSNELLNLWTKLDGYDPDETYDFGISMEDYAVALHMELSKRRIPHRKLTKKGKK